ncbi:MAG: helix-turn-helix transcriptional regulator [Acidimicrobiales bacterium]
MPKRADPVADADLIALGDRLRTLRQAAGLTQEQVAEAAGLHWTYVSQIERGTRNLGYRNIVRLAEAVGVTAPHLIDLDAPA